MQNYQYINLEFLKNFTRNNDQQMIKYMRMFIDNSEGAMAKMEEQAAEEKWAELRATAHSIKPQATYMGISDLKELLLQIEEDAGNETNIQELPNLVEQAKTLRNNAVAELEAAIEELQ